MQCICTTKPPPLQPTDLFFFYPPSGFCTSFFFLCQTMLQLPPSSNSQQSVLKKKTTQMSWHGAAFLRVGIFHTPRPRRWQLLWGRAGTAARASHGALCSLCLCWKWRGLSPPLRDLRQRSQGDMQDAASNVHNGPPFMRPGSRRKHQRWRKVLPDIWLPIAPSLHHFPSSVWAAQAKQTVPTSSCSHQGLLSAASPSNKPARPTFPWLHMTRLHTVWKCANDF